MRRSLFPILVLALWGVGCVDEGDPPGSDAEAVEAEAGQEDGGAEHADGQVLDSASPEDSGGEGEEAGQGGADASQEGPDAGGGALDAGTPADATGVDQDAASGDAASGMDSALDDAGVDASADAEAGSSDAGNSDTGAGDAGADAAPCWVTRTQPDDTLLFAPGESERIALFADTLLGYAGTGRWSLWSRRTGAMVATSAMFSVAGDSVLAVGPSHFVTSLIEGGEQYVLLRSADDGRQLSRVQVTSGALVTRAGVAPDGSYFWTLHGGYSPNFKAFAVGSTTPWLAITLEPKEVWAEPNELVALVSDSTSTTLNHYPRVGSASTVGPFAGQYLASFSNHTHLFTRAAGGIVRLFAASGGAALFSTTSASSAGGAAGIFWIHSAGDERVDAYRLSTTTTPLRTFGNLNNNFMALQDGFIVPDGRVHIDGDTLRVASRVSWNVATYRGVDAYVDLSSGIWLPGWTRPVGCGRILSMAADADRLYISTEWAGTFLYEAPFRAPLARLAPGGDVLTTRSSSRFAIRDLPGSEVTPTRPLHIYARDLAPVATLSLPYPSGLSLNADGTRVGVATGIANPLVGTWKVLRVSDGQELSTVSHPYTIRGGVIAGARATYAVSFSPSGNRIAVGGESVTSPYTQNATYVYEGTTLIGTFPGMHGEWIDENTLYGALDEGASIISAEGIRIGPFACGFSLGLWQNVQWMSANSYATIDTMCDVVANTSTAAPRPSGGLLVARFPGTLVSDVLNGPRAVRVFQ